MSRVVASAIEAALEGDSPGFDHDEPHHRSRHRGLKAMATGAALVGAVQVVRSQVPKLSKLDALTTLGKITRVPDMVREMPDRMRARLADIGLGDEDEGDLGSEDLADEEELDDDEDYDEPEAEGEDDAAEDDDDEPEAEADDGPDDEGGDWPDDDHQNDGDCGDGAVAEAEEQQVAFAPREGLALEQAADGLHLDTNGHRTSGRDAVPDISMIHRLNGVTGSMQ